MKTLLFFTLMMLYLYGCTTRNQKVEQINSEALNADTSSILTSENVNLISPSEKKISLNDIEVGMRDEKVKAILGKPTKIDVLISELGARVEDWW